MKKHYKQVVASFETGYESIRNKIIRDKQHPFYGGTVDGYLLAEPIAGIGWAGNFATLYSCAESKYYRDPLLLEDIISSCEYVFRHIHENGTIDLLITDYQAPATFDIISLIRAYRVFMNNCGDSSLGELPMEKETGALLLRLIEKLAQGLLNCGFRTPNHRWVETAGLLMAYNLLGWPELKTKAGKYLAEGIDIDEYGEFTERSPGMYNAVNDNALLIMAEEGDLPYLNEYVIKNMDLLFDYIEGDGSIFTQNSRRKDKGEGAAAGKFYPGHPYYFLYLWAGFKFQNARYIKFAEKIFDDSVKGGRGAPGPLWLYLTIPELKTWEPEQLKNTVLEDEYNAFYPLSNIYRRRKDFFSYSVIANNPNFLFVKCGDVSLYLRICASFFAKAQFMPGEVIKTNEGHRMEISVSDDYKLPFDQPPPTSDWYAMDHASRKHVCRCELTITVDFIDLPDGVRLKVKTSGTETVPFKIEYIVSPNCRVETANIAMDAHAGEYIAVKSGGVRLEQVDKGYTILIQNLFAKHLYHTGMRGSVPQVKEAFTIYSTDYTPIDTQVDIRCLLRESAYTTADDESLRHCSTD